MMVKKHGFAIFLIILAAIIWGITYSDLPSQVPIHFGVDGPDGYTTKGIAVLTGMGLLIGTYILMSLAPKIDPNQENIQKSKKTIGIMNRAVVTLLFGVNMMIVMSALGMKISSHISIVAVGILLVVIGNYLQQCKPNYFIGIKNPWTLSNENVWKKTHRLGSKLFVLAGLCMMMSVFLPNLYQPYIIIGVVVALVMMTTIYSYVVFKKEISKTAK